MEKNVVKKRMKSLRRNGDSHEDVATLAREFQHLIQRLCKLNKVVKVEEWRSKANKQRREFLKDFHKFTKGILDDDNCSTIDTWVEWSGMRANVPKCVTMAIQSSTGTAYDPKLSLLGQSIPFIEGATFRFLGSPISIHSSVVRAKQDLLAKLQSLLDRVDCTLLTGQQKLLLYKVGICPRLAWDLSTAKLFTTWLRSTLQPLATLYLKRWSGLAKTTDSNKLFLPKRNGVLDLPDLHPLYHKLQVSKAGRFVLSRDPVMRIIATKKTVQERYQPRAPFKPFGTVIEAMKKDPSASKSAVARMAKDRVQTSDITVTPQVLFKGRPSGNLRVKMQCYHGHPPPQQEPVPVEEVAIAFMSPMWSGPEPTCSSSREEIQQEA